MTLPLITAALAGALLVLQQLLMLTVGLRRASTRQGVGFGDDRDLERLVRRHGNLAENAAIFLVVLGLLEIVGANTIAVLSLAVVFLVARLAHVLAFSSLAGSHGGEYAAEAGRLPVVSRFIGAMGTVFGGLAAGIYVLVVAYGLIFG